MGNKFQPSIAIPPGVTIQEIIDDRGMTQKELAERLQVTPKHINKLIKGTASLTYDMALRLESVLGIPSSFWNNLETKYQDTLARMQALPQLTEETQLLKKIPYDEMSNKGWIPMASSSIEKIKNLRSYFRVVSLDCLPTVEATAFRKSEAFNANEYALAAWINQCEFEAQENSDINSYNAEKLADLLPKIRRLTTRPLKSSWKDLVILCAEAGVSCVMVEALLKTHVNGATKWLSNDRVMVALTTRGKYEDIFWFTFFHEIGHVFQNKKNIVFIDIENDEVDQLEKDADKFAMDFLIPQDKYSSFLKQADFLDIKKIREFSIELGVNIGIVIGRLMKEKYIDFGDAKYQRLRQKI
ncbi:HigA family addiction module antidote protein [Paenibacillus tritici]|uniref:HigA family addiction module antidote protein n=1 Tax=Paenibacillus tritici TaxID=1873425 RepID=A0ABX2DIW1_9BACL|nr:HigA family addiction module antitoxin [Paenibacillus tritici]NQX44435.1 HigA family addiction module antidote protein [Paenibacillus tritici]